MKNLLVGILLLFPFFLVAQNKSNEAGISFEKSSSWKTVLLKAKKEHKYIFVDCYATWCGPCKSMDKNVYSLDSLGKFTNLHYISIKVQMDSTSNDDESTKNWYEDAHFLRNSYTVKELPTFLFFSSTGELLHKAIGYKSPKTFMKILNDGLDTSKQYYTNLRTFQQGNLPDIKLMDLAKNAISIYDTQNAINLFEAYFKKCIIGASHNEIYTKKNIEFMAVFVKRSKDKVFNIFCQHAQIIDSVMKTPGYAWNLIDPIIEQEEINKDLFSNTQSPFSIRVIPNWEALHQTIATKYNTGYADRTILWAKIKWLELNESWTEYCKNVILRVEKYGPYFKTYPYTSISSPTNFTLNACAWDIFTNSKDSTDLKIALSWSEKALKLDSTHDASFLDTYANLLYKLGKVNDALPLEEKAVTTAQPIFLKEIRQNFDKMKNGEPTWPAR